MDFNFNNNKTQLLIRNKSIKAKLKPLMLPKNIAKLTDNKLGLISDADYSNAINVVFFYTKIFSEEINEFIKKKDEYESLLYNESYVEALEVLDYVEDNICTSLWGIKQKLVINDMTGGLEKNKLYLESISKKANGQVYVDIIFNSYSMMSESKTSYENYQNYINRYFGNSEGNMISYLKYKLDMNYVANLEDFSNIVQVESYSSVIDLYLTFIDIFPQIFISNIQNSSPEIRPDLFDSICDNRLDNLLILTGVDKVLLDSKLNNSKSREINQIIERYSVGDYLYVNKNLPKYLDLNKTDFQAITLLVKSYIQSHESSESLKGIAKDIYNLYDLNENYYRSEQNMYKYRKQYKGTSWEPKISYFLKRRNSLEDIRLEDKISSYLNDVNITPNFSNLIVDSSIKQIFFEHTNKYYPFTNQIIQYNELELIEDEFRKKYIELKKSKNLTKENYQIFINMILDSEYSFFSRERVAIALLERLFNEEEYLKYIILTVKLYFENSLFIKRLNLDNCLVEIKKFTSSNIKKSINYPIFIYICDKNNKRNKTIAIANFLDHNSIFEIEQLLNAEFDVAQKLFFLHQILDIYSLKKDVRFLTDSKNAEKIRIEILNWLAVNDSINKKVYNDEVNEITKQAALKDRISRINKSKIFVDTQKIYNENKKLWEEDYANYVETKKFDREIYSTDIESFKGMSDVDFFKKRTKGINSEIKNDLVYHQEILMLKSLLNNILDDLLTSTNHGLETYLSSRIRHGYTKNHLTHVFYMYNLMSKSDAGDNGNYYVNEFWDNKNYSDQHNFNEFKDLISEFTANIDTKVNIINNEWIQIKRNKNDTGLFDYTDLVDIFIVGYHNKSFRNLKDLFDGFVQTFWIKTEVNLKELRIKVDEDLKKYYYSSLDNLENKVSDLNKRGIELVISDFLSSINLCRTGIETTIKDFSAVFEKPNMEHNNFTMSELCETALSISNKMFRQFDNIKIQKDISSEEIYDGKYFPHLIDSLGILINNAIEHSGLSKLSELELVIEVSTLNEDSEEEKYYRDIFSTKNINLRQKPVFNIITVKNNLGNHVDKKILETKIKKAFEQVESFDSIKEFIQSEGGTGLIKLTNIFKNSMPVPFSILYDVQDSSISISIVFENESIVIEKEI